MVEALVSGGQTGVDRAALDACLELGFPCGGFCPRGRRAEDGTIPTRYPLVETPSDDPAERTAWNVRDSDGTLIFVHGRTSGGTALTVDHAVHLGKPLLVVDLDAPVDLHAVARWAGAQRIRTLNVAGPRESEQPGIHAEVLATMRALLPLLRG